MEFTNTTSVLGMFRKSKQTLLALSVAATLGFSSASSANIFKDAINWVDNTANTVADATVDAFDTTTTAVVDTTTTVVDTTTDTANDIASFTQSSYDDAIVVLEDGYNEAVTTLEGVATDIYEAAAEAAFQQMKDPMVNMADAWKTLAANEPAKYQALVVAIQNNDSQAISDAILDVLVSLYSYAGFSAIVQDFKDANAGSILLIVSAGAGAGATAHIDAGIALDIDYVIDVGNVLAKGSSPTFDGAIASLFAAEGLQIGPAAGGGVDFVIGYHLANPDGVYGPGLDLSLEIKLAAGGSVGMSYDISQAPWQIVAGGIGVGAGAEVKAAAGPSYTEVLFEVCADGSMEGFASDCKGKTDPDIQQYVSSGSSTTSGIMGSQLTVDEKWNAVSVNSSTFNPAVFLSAPTYNGGDGGVMRLDNVSSQGFSMRFQEWDYLDGQHVNENVDYVMLPEGNLNSTDGSKWEIGSFNLSGTGKKTSIVFNHAFDRVPYVFLMIQTYNGTQAVMVRASSVSETGFDAALFEQESLQTTGHSQEKISYLAVAPAHGSTSGVFGYQMNILGFDFSIDIPFTVYKANINDAGVKLGNYTYYLQEEQSADDETSHTATETINVLELGSVALVQQVTSHGSDTVSIRRK